jgi:tetratricopeptide (TPR) repeat protein
MSTQPQLTQLENAGLIRLAAVEPELAYLFRHGLIQDAAYSTLLRAQRQRWHLATARVIESTCRSETETVSLAPILARHFSLAGDRPRALHFLVIAGDAAFDHYANVEAASFYGLGLEIANAPEAEYDPQLMQHLFSRHGRALELTSRFEAALDNYRVMEATARKRGDKALALAAVMARATIHSTANMAQDVSEAASLLERVGSLAHEIGDLVAEANINWTLLLNNTMSGGEAARSIAYGQHALDLARALNQRELTAFILTDLWFAYGAAGQWEQARAALDEGSVMARELGNLSVLCENLGRQGMTALILGNYDEALARMAESYEAAEAANSTDFRALMRSFAGLIHTDRGDIDRAIAISEEAIGYAQVSSNVTVLIGTRSDLGRTYAMMGAVEHAQALAELALESAGRFELLRPWPGATIVRLHLMQHDLAMAATAFAGLPDFRELMRRAGFVPFMWANLALAGIELALARENWSGAALLAQEIVGHLEPRGMRYLLPEVRLLQARAHLALGQDDGALAALQTARAEAEALGSRRLLWPILAALAEIASARGQVEATSLRQQAREIVNYIAARAPTPALRQSFLASAGVQSLLKAVG